MKTSAGLLVFRFRDRCLEVFIVHMGGPLWEKKERRAWSIPKGEVDPGEEPLDAALREYREETGLTPPPGELINLGEFEQSKRKRILIWAVEGEADASKVESINFELEWPPKSGQIKEFPEVDRGGWFSVKDASDRLIKGQVQVIEALEGMLANGSG